MPSQPARSKATVPIVVAAVAAMVTGLLLLTPALAESPAEKTANASTNTAASQSPQDGDNPLLRLARRDPKDAMAIGDVDAPVVMVNYSEFQCPFCGKFARDTEPTMMEYVEQGVLRMEWRDFPYLGPESTTAAHAARAAGAQGEFWAFHDAMFADQQPPNSGKVTEEYLVGIAAELGLDTETFRADMTSPEVAAAVQRDFEEGQQIGVTGTPAFIINGQPIIGAQPTEVFVEAVEQAADTAR